MNISSRIANRHLFGKHSIGYISFISIISTIGLAIGVTALILTISVLNGFGKELKSKLINFDSHIRLRLLYKDSMDSTKAVQSTLDSMDQVKTTVPYIHRNVIIRKGNNTDGIIVEGMRRADIRKTLDIDRFIIRGELKFHTESGKDGIVIGKKLADYLGAEIGSEVYLFVINADKATVRTSPRIGRFTVTGIYHSGISEYDNVFVYTNLQAAQDLFQMSNYTGLQMLVNEPTKSEQIARKINSKLGFPYHAFSWNELHSNLLNWLKLQRFPILLVFGLIIVVALFNLISALTMIVIEKKRDIGILKAMGMNKIQIIKIFLQESIMIGIAGVVLGFILSLFLAWLQNKYGLISIPEDVYFMNTLPVLLRVRDFVIIGGAALLASILTTIYPAYKASSVFPHEVINYE